MSKAFVSRAWWRQFLFRLFGELFKSNTGRKTPLPEKPKRILVLLPVLRGDYIVLSPLIRGLATTYPTTEIGVVITRASRELAKADPYVHKVIMYHKLPAWPRSIYRIWKYKPDIVVLPKGHPAFTESMLLLLSRAKFRVGLSHPHHDSLLTHPVAHGAENEHRSEACARLLGVFGLDPSNVSRRLHIGKTPYAEERANEFFAKQEKSKTWISINVSAGSSARRWPKTKWKQLVECLHDTRNEFNFLFLCAPADQDMCQELDNELEYATTVSTGGFLEASAYVARTGMLISPDTGTIHAAAARGVPVVVLYNADKINYVRFAPQSVHHRAIFPESGRDVNSITVQEVFHEVVLLMAEINI